MAQCAHPTRRRHGTPSHHPALPLPAPTRVTACAWSEHEPNPASPIAAGPTLPRAMRDAPRKEWPWAVAESLWPLPVPEYIAWQSGIVADRSEAVWQSVTLPGWHRRFCKKHDC